MPHVHVHRSQSMVDGELGDLGVSAHVPVVVVCSTLLGNVTTLCPRMEANTVRAKEFSTVPAIQKTVLTAMVRVGIKECDMTDNDMCIWDCSLPFDPLSRFNFP